MGMIVYKLSQQKCFFVEVGLKSSMAQLQVNDVQLFYDDNSYLVAQNVFGYCNCLGQKRSIT